MGIERWPNRARVTLNTGHWQLGTCWPIVEVTLLGFIMCFNNYYLLMFHAFAMGTCLRVKCRGRGAGRGYSATNFVDCFVFRRISFSQGSYSSPIQADLLFMFVVYVSTAWHMYICIIHIRTVCHFRWCSAALPLKGSLMYCIGVKQVCRFLRETSPLSSGTNFCPHQPF